MKISAFEMKVGNLMSINNKLWRVLKLQHVKPGKGPAFVRMKLKNLESGAVVDRTFRADETVQRAVIDRRPIAARPSTLWTRIARWAPSTI